MLLPTQTNSLSTAHVFSLVNNSKTSASEGVLRGVRKECDSRKEQCDDSSERMQ